MYNEIGKQLIKVDNIKLSFVVSKYKYDTLKERIVHLFQNPRKKVTILDNISFSINKGESLGVIGRNGAGKSTLLKIVSGIYRPSSGSVVINGSTVLLSLRAGFDGECSAVENIYLNGALFGFTHKEMKSKVDSIIEFAELENFKHLPLKNYSSGMVSRLGFAIAINVHPDLLLVDEVLSVGDTNFQKKCMDKIFELKKTGVSFLFVSHNINQVKKLCQKTLWIEDSKIKEYGNSNDVCCHYLEFCKKIRQNSNDE